MSSFSVLAMPYDRPDSLSVRLSSPNKLASLGRNHSERNQAEEIPLPPALHRFLVAPTTRSPSSPQVYFICFFIFKQIKFI